MSKARLVLVQLPSEILALVCGYLPLRDRHAARLACKLLRDATDSPGVWSNFTLNLESNSIGKICADKKFLRVLRCRCIQSCYISQTSLPEVDKQNIGVLFRNLSTLKNLTASCCVIFSIQQAMTDTKKTKDKLLPNLRKIIAQPKSCSEHDGNRCLKCVVDIFPGLVTLGIDEPITSDKCITEYCFSKLKGLTGFSLHMGLFLMNGVSWGLFDDSPNGRSFYTRAMILAILTKLPRLERLSITGQLVFGMEDYAEDEVNIVKEVMSRQILTTLSLELYEMPIVEGSPWFGLFTKLTSLKLDMTDCRYDVLSVLRILQPSLPKLTHLSLETGDINALPVPWREKEQVFIDFTLLPAGLTYFRLCLYQGSRYKALRTGVFGKVPDSLLTGLTEVDMLQAPLKRMDIQLISTRFKNLKSLSCSLNSRLDPEALLELQHSKSLRQITVNEDVRQKFGRAVQNLREATGNKIVTSFVSTYEYCSTPHFEI